MRNNAFPNPNHVFVLLYVNSILVEMLWVKTQQKISGEKKKRSQGLGSDFHHRNNLLSWKLSVHQRALVGISDLIDCISIHLVVEYGKVLTQENKLWEIDWYNSSFYL